jgi:hypothetical protein
VKYQPTTAGAAAEQSETSQPERRKLQQRIFASPPLSGFPLRHESSRAARRDCARMIGRAAGWHAAQVKVHDTPHLPETERQRLFLREVQSAAEPFDRQAREAGANAVTLAVMGLRALYLLNGGALIVFPAYLSLLGTDVDTAYRAAVVAAAIFVAGLGLAAVATILGYVSEAQRARTATRAQEAAAAALRESCDVMPPDLANARAPDTYKTLDTYKTGAARSARSSRRWRVAAAVAAFLSLACFVGGSYFAAVAVMTAPPDDEETGVSRIMTAL